MAEICFAAAFAGGVLSLLAPCSALLLPMFFAYAFTSRTQLLGRTFLFLAGLSTVFVPLGMGASLVAALLLDYRDATVLAAGIMLIGFGMLEISGKGFSFLPPRLAARFQGGQSAAAVYGSGLVYGLAGFCSGPLLGAVLTLAGSTAQPLLGAALLFTYAVGTAAPLFVIAWLWDRHNLGKRQWLRGRAVHIGPLRLHSTNLMAGLLFILVGVSFIAFQGGAILGGVYEEVGLGTLGFVLQGWIADHVGGGVSDVAWLAAIVVVAGGVWLRQRRRVAAGR